MTELIIIFQHHLGVKLKISCIAKMIQSREIFTFTFLYVYAKNNVQLLQKYYNKLTS